MAISVTTTNQLAHDTGVKMIVYAESGMGKTVLCATLPRPIIISAESGLLSLKRENIERIYGVNTPGIAYDIPVIEIKTAEQVDEAYDFIMANSQHFDSIALDSLTEIAELVLAAAKLDPEAQKNKFHPYSKLIDVMSYIIRKFRDIPAKNVYMTAKLAKVKDEVTGITAYGADMPGNKLGPSIPYFFDEVFFLTTAKDATNVSYRYIKTDVDIQHIVKDRSGACNAAEYPHLGAIIEKIKVKLIQGV